VPAKEDLPFVRGRIVLGEQLRRHADLKDRHVCAYAELTSDTAENRIILAALRLLFVWRLRPRLGATGRVRTIVRVLCVR
jgi:5-methylcytosine-specific restriction endonuclease McrBC regulatory subunit McrC